MSEKQDLVKLQNAFIALPPSIKEWLSSEQIVYIIQEINNRLGFSGEKIIIIPNLILRLVVQDIEPQEFINELSKELGVEFSVAKTITEDIEKNALRPIATELRNKTGLEVKLIYYGKEGGEKTKIQIPDQVIKSTAAPAPLQQTTQATAQTKPMSPLTFAASPLPPAKTAPAPVAAAPIPPLAPFILHQESPTSAPTLNRNNPTTAAAGQAAANAGQAGSPQGIAMPKTSLTMKVQNYFQSAETPERTVPRPVSIKIETPPEQRAPAPQAPSAPLRVVHYSNLRTPINDLGLPKKEINKDNIVDLRKFN